MKPYNYIISGGGTGGHIYPAIAIANALREKNQEAKIIFVGSKGKMEMEKVPQSGYNIHGLWISGLHRGQFWRNVLFPLKLGVSLFQALLLWLRYRPRVIVGTGGYASGPMLFIGNLLGSKTLIQEQNSFAGITNKLLAKKANAIAVAYPQMDRYFPSEKIQITGNPVRSELMATSTLRTKALSFFGLVSGVKTLVVLGGSLGAQKINELIEQQLPFFERQGVQLVWQCGRMYYDRFASHASKNIKVHAFIREMDLLYAAADLIISRAGAASISELCLVAKPTLLIPSPNVAENHQFHNANALVKQNAALVLEEDKLSSFEKVFAQLLADETLQKTMVKNMKTFARPNATNDIVKLIQSF